MNYKIIAYSAAFSGLVLLALNLFLNRHILPFYGPSIGGRFPASANCERDADTLLIALHAYPHLYSEGDFGLGEAVRTIDQDDCLELPVRHPGPKFISGLQRFAETQKNRAVPGRPSPILFRNRHVPGYLPDGFYPAGGPGRLYSLWISLPELYSGNGIIHYLRCDYSLGYEPFHTFILSDLHRGRVSEDTEERLSECGVEQAFRAEVQGILDAIHADIASFQE